MERNNCKNSHKIISQRMSKLLKIMIENKKHKIDSSLKLKPKFNKKLIKNLMKLIRCSNSGTLLMDIMRETVSEKIMNQAL